MLNVKFVVFVLLVILNMSCAGKSSVRHIDKSDSVIPEKSNEQISSFDSEEVEHIALFSECSNYNNNLSTIASKVQFIALDIEPSINDFKVSDIEIGNDFVFLSGMDYILKYDRNGRFVKNIGSRGMGPEEFIQIFPPLQLNREEELIYVFDEMRRKIICYNYDGKFQKTIPVNFNNTCIGIIDSTVIALRQMFPERFLPNCQSIRFINLKGQKTNSYSSSLYPVNKENIKRFGSETSFLWENNGKFYSLEYGADTIFRIRKDSLIAARVLSGKLKLNKNELFIDGRGDKLDISSFIQRPNSGIFESNNFILFRLSSEKERFFMVYNKQTKQLNRTYHENAPSRFDNKWMDYFTDDIVSGLSFNPQYQSQGWAIALIPAMDIDEKRNDILDFIAKHPSQESEKLKKIVQNITEMDNSLVMLVRFK